MDRRALSAADLCPLLCPRREPDMISALPVAEESEAAEQVLLILPCLYLVCVIAQAGHGTGDTSRLHRVQAMSI